MSAKAKGNIIYYTGLAVSITAPLIAAAAQFPVWTETVDSRQVSGIFVFVALLCLIPLFNHFKTVLRSPSSTLLWSIVFFISWSLSKIIDEIVIVSLTGALSNAAGAVLCGIGNRLRRPSGGVINAEIEDR